MKCFHLFTGYETEVVGYLLMWKKICKTCGKILDSDVYHPRWR